MECADGRFIGPDAEFDGRKHAEKNPGHRVHITESRQVIVRTKDVR
jgi:hypothetical protein